ncbi:hypothetical protein BGZ60DRAFT_248626 [Tricladium varicosporioides]|nr:hypothetical protein BGZ60DRAFT_248626 [Hymenoscyphus varicosporioides]
MMATEATSEILATSSTTPDHELNTTETSSQDVSSTDLPIVNGNIPSDKDEIKKDADHVESNVNSAEVSVSGGSDTEASKAETSKTQTDEKGHARTTSTVKKLASFKPVSVNKTFLAAKVSTTSTTSKLGDKGPISATAAQSGPSTSAAPRPRLVAKLGSGLRDSAPRNSATANGSKAGAAPDASAVWNKNRPAPPPEPKRFTDEELKQRYGIHLATRLQSDDPGKEKNWADIDDDDDDWAPETIEWTDGTKITLPQADETPAPTPEPIPTPAPVFKETKIEAPKSKSPAPTQSSASPAIKPTTGLSSGRAGLVLKGATEKPTLVAKPPGPPTPVKSPWAPLPPVDKVAPIAIDIPQNQQQQQNRFGQRDPHGFQAMPPPPAKEIAADDFSRSWRDGNSSASRELYNSQSGRYEPVNDARRGSQREMHSRQPAVLQRPQQDGPAEPSPAFQTHRAGGQDAAYGRRRTSSNVSGGSGNFARRMSRGHDMPPHEILNIRRGSLAAVSDAPSSPRGDSPSGQNLSQRGYQNQHQAWASRASPVISHPSPQSIHGQLAPSVSGSVDGQSQPLSAIPSDDQVFEEQKRRMLKARELAIKRRQEEEAKEEAARKERIRIKLEAMGPPPEKKKDKKSTPVQEKAVPVQIQAREAAEVPAVVKPLGESDGSRVTTSAITHEPSPTSTIDNKAEVKTDKTSPDNRTNGLQTEDPAHSSAAQHNQQENRPSQPWQSSSASSSERYQPQNPWAPPGQQSSSRAVWGPPPSTDRTLGNGTFNSELSRVPNMNQPHPGPIGPPSANRGSSSQYSQGRSRDSYVPRPVPIGPPLRQQDPSVEERRRLVAQSGWGLAPEKIQHDETIIRNQQELDRIQRQELQEKGMAPEAVQPSYKETWRQVTLNEDGSRSNSQTIHTDLIKGSGPSSQGAPGKSTEDAVARPFANEGPPRHHADGVSGAPQPQFTDTWRPAQNINGPPRVRDSRFFPNNRDVRLEEQQMPFDRPGSPSPPPPTMAGHPAYDGDSAHPHVSLPRPAPVVKLPPAVLAPIGPPKPISFAAAVIAPAVPATAHGSPFPRQDYASRAAINHQDIRRAPEAVAGGWQDRINSLIGRKNSPPKSHALAVDSASKHALELPHSQLAATVSLPLSSSNVDSSVTTKPAAEECFEEQEMGSLPAIRVPSQAPVNAWQLAPQQPKSLPRKFLASEVISKDSYYFSDTYQNNRPVFLAKLPGQVDAKTFILPYSARQKSNPRRGGTRGGSSRGASSTPRGGRGRDGSTGFQSPNTDNNSVSSSPNPSGRGGPRGGRGYGSNWNRQVSTPIQT